MLDTDNLLIPGLTRIAYVKCSDLPRHIRRMAQAGIIPTVSVESVDIDFFGDSKLEFSRSKDGKETSTSHSHPPMTFRSMTSPSSHRTDQGTDES